MKTSLLAIFKKYCAVGVMNTILHWGVFFLLIALIDLATGWANLIAFFVAVSLSYYLNARYTFEAAPTKSGYFYFVVFMAILSFTIGWFTDSLQLAPFFALVIFSMLSLISGFLYLRYIAFRDF